jgi:sarcosine oxidase
MQSTFDVIVIGVGGMGSAACFELARRGLRVLGLEQFPPVHDQGSSHGVTRIIRTAYFENPSYVPLLQRAWERWYEIERLQGAHLLTECGCLNLGRPDSAVVRGVRQSAQQHGLSIEVLESKDLRRRFPPFRLDDDYVGVLEHQGGFLYVENCVRTHIAAARQHGATIVAEEPALSWTASGDRVTVTTAKMRYHAARLVITAGPWAGQLLAEHGANLRVMRQTLLWFGTQDDAAFQRNRFPVWIGEFPLGHFYGFPIIDAAGLKVAQHYGAPELLSPDQVERQPRPEDESPVRAFLQRYVPSANGPVRQSAVCTYTLSPDRHFIIDVHPEHRNVSIAAGFSGHGFKFASVVGEIMADLAEKQETTLPIGMFRLARFRQK